VVSGPWPLPFDATDWLVGGAPYDFGVAVGQVDRHGGFGHVHGHGLMLVLAAECDLLTGDQDRAGGLGASLHGDRFGRGPRDWPDRAGSLQSRCFAGRQRVWPRPQ